MDILTKGGILMIPILCCSVLVFAIFFERIIRYTIYRKREKDIEKKVTKLVSQDRSAEALSVSRKNRSPVGRVLEKAIAVKDLNPDILETVITNAAQNEVRELSSHLQALATIGNIAPLLGLLGTIIGMIKAFMVIQQTGGKVNATVLAGGIWEALLTTALGLAVALPAVVMHSYLINRVNRHEARIQNSTVLFLKTLAKKEA